MSYTELLEWGCFEQINPFGEWRADLRSAMVASVLVNCHRTSGPPAKIKDFMPEFMTPPEESPEVMKAKILAFVRKANRKTAIGS